VGRSGKNGTPWEIGISEEEKKTMTEEQLKESISFSFFKLIANKTGFKCDKPTDGDNGIDAYVRRVLPVNRNGTMRQVEFGGSLDFQLKSTCQKHITFLGQSLKYDLKSKNYNDLVARKPGKCISPLFLILFVLPDDQNTWINLDPSTLVVNGSAFWYFAKDGDAMVENESSSKRIEIPLANRLDMDVIRLIHEDTFGHV
jgi:hypothetical protein